MRILVTGASGFLGGFVCRELCDAGHDVSALVRRPGSAPPGPGRGGGRHHRRRRGAGCRPWLEAAPDCVIHLAAEIASQRDAGRIHEVNVEGTRALLAACEAAGFAQVRVRLHGGHGRCGRGAAGARSFSSFRCRPPTGAPSRRGAAGARVGAAWRGGAALARVRARWLVRRGVREPDPPASGGSRSSATGATCGTWSGSRTWRWPSGWPPRPPRTAPPSTWPTTSPITFGDFVGLTAAAMCEKPPRSIPAWVARPGRRQRPGRGRYAVGAVQQRADQARAGLVAVLPARRGGGGRRGGEAAGVIIAPCP